MLTLASLSLWWERLWPRLWPAVAVAGVFTAIVLLDLLPLMPDWLHLGTLAVFVVAFAALLSRAFMGVTSFDREAARRRLEQDSCLAFRPLEGVDDRLSAGRGDALARALWQRHQQRLAAAVNRLQVRLPAPGMAGREPWGIRASVLLLVIIALGAGGGQAVDRLNRALTPLLSDERVVPLVEVWISPPAHTGRAPIFLHGAAGLWRAGGDSMRGTGPAQPIEVPQASELFARVSGVSSAPKLQLGREWHDMEPMSADVGLVAEPSPVASSFGIERAIDGGGTVAVWDRGDELASWAIRVMPDQVPEIRFSHPPQAVGNGLVRLAFRAVDDYQVREVVALIRRPADLKRKIDSVEEEIRIALPLTTASDGGVDAGAASQHASVPATGTGSSVVLGEKTVDLSAHPWAGNQVMIVLAATDNAGQVGVSPPADFELPKRAFGHPVARAVVAQRSRLFDDQGDRRVRRSVAMALQGVARRPEAFAHDVAVALAVSVARSRLLYDHGPAALSQVQVLLWKTALRLEEGDVPVAELALRAARSALLDALRDNAPIEQIEQLIDVLRDAVERYLAAVAAELARRGDATAPRPAAEMLRTADLMELLEMTRRYARAGAREGARQLLSELQRLLDGIQTGLQMDDKRRELMEAHEIMGGLRGLALDQQELLDDTFQAMRRGAHAPRNDRSSSESLASEQAELRRRLGEAMVRAGRFIGTVPPALGEADGAMAGALEAFELRRNGDPVPHQTHSVDALNRGIDAIGEAVAERLGGVMGLFGANPDELGDGGSDPFGRAPDDAAMRFGVGHVAIPDEMDIQRAYKILHELRRRAGQRSRSFDELQYIERLLRHF
jgi:uncharacterized protein (TIGR02302 family)